MTLFLLLLNLCAGELNAALHYLARMIKAGEDPLHARRMVIFASGRSEISARMRCAGSCLYAGYKDIGCPNRS